MLQNGLPFSRKTVSNGQRVIRLNMSVFVRLAPGAAELRWLVIGGANVYAHAQRFMYEFKVRIFEEQYYRKLVRIYHRNPFFFLKHINYRLWIVSCGHR